MSTDQLASDSRSISELYGTVLIIAISFLTAMLLFGFGTFILGGIGGDTEDRITQDSMFEMEDRLAEISGSQVDSNTQFSFPDTDGDDLETMPDHGTVNVTVENTTALEYLEASDESNTTEFDVGTIKHETDDGIVTAYQGGAMIRQQGDFSTMLTDPPFDYDGTMVAFDFVDTTSMPGAQPGQEITARTNVEGAQAFSEEIEDLLSPKWSYLGEGDFIAPINVTVSIETEYYEAWEEYAEEGMTESPDSVETDSADGMVEMTFDDVGTERQPPRYEANEILYAGMAENVFEGWNRFNQNATINESEDRVRLTYPDEGNGPQATQLQQIAFYDEYEEEWLIHGNEQGVAPGHNEWNNLSTWDSNEERFEDPEDPTQIDGYDDQGSNYEEYEFNPDYDVPICIVAYEENIGPSGNSPNGVIDYLETCAANLDVPDPVEYMPTELEVSFEEEDYEATVGEDHSVDLFIENVGLMESTSEHDVALYYEIDGELILADYETSEEIGELEPEDEETITTAWLPPNEDVDQLHAVVGQQDADNASVNVTDEGPQLDITVEEDTDNVLAPGDSLSVNTTVENSAGATATDAEVVMEDEAGDIVDLTTVTVPGDDYTTVELDWLAPLDEFDSTEELTVEVDESSDTHEVSPEGLAEFEVTDVDPGVASSDDGLDVGVEIENVGTGPGEQDVILEVDGETLDEPQVADVDNRTLDDGETDELTLSWDSTAELETGDANEVTVRTEDDAVTESYDVEAIYQMQSLEVDQSEIAEEDLDEDIEVTAEIENVGDVSDTQSVNLTTLDDSMLDIETQESDVEIAGDESETVTFEPTIEEESLTGEFKVETDADESTERVVIVRDGATCENIHYADPSDPPTLSELQQQEPIEITYIDELQCMDELEYQSGTNLFGNPIYEPIFEADVEWELSNDIDAYGTEHWNDGEGFEPIGEWFSVSETGQGFEGELDGNGRTIEGLYIDRESESGVGIFAVTEFDDDGVSTAGDGSLVANLTVEDAQVTASEVVGVLAGNVGGTLQNVAVLDSKVEAVDGQRAGLVVGRGSEGDLSNQLVATGSVQAAEEHSSNSLGVGGIVGRTSYETDFNTSYARADISAPNNVGGLAGSSSWYDTTFEDMYFADSVDSEETEGGAIVGPIQSFNDEFQDSVYWAEDLQSEPNDGFGPDNTGNTPEPSDIADAEWEELGSSQMVGPQVLPTAQQVEEQIANGEITGADSVEEFYDQFPGVDESDAEGTMANLDWDIWEPVYDFNATTGEIENEDYPQFEWESEAEGAFQVSNVDSPETVKEGEELDLTATIDSTYGDDETQTILLRDGEGTPLDSHETTIEGSDFGESETKTIDLTWDVGFGTDGPQELIIQTDDDQVLHEVEVESIEEPEFEVTDVSTEDNNSDAGEDIEIDVDLENTGGEGSEVVVLEEEVDGDYRYLNHTDVSLDAGENNTETLTWQSTVHDGGNSSLQVRTLDDTESLDIFLEPQEPAEFNIESVETNDPVLAGQTLTVDATIENEGNLNETQFVSLAPDGTDTVLDIADVELDGDESKTVELVWNVPIPDVQAIEVSTQDDAMTKEVEILSPTADDIGFGNPLDIDVDLIEFDDS